MTADHPSEAGIRSSRAAVLHAAGQPWTVEDVTVHPPKAGEVVVQWKVAGMCHSDEHLVTGDMAVTDEMIAMGVPPMMPIIGGHEGAGVVVEIGEGVSSVAVGDHVSTSFVPSCGSCRYCLTGQQNLCDWGAGTLTGGMITDGTHRHFLADGHHVQLLAKLGTFGEVSCVSERSVIKVDPDYPFEAVALVSCGVATGFGSATNRASVRAGDTVVVVGTGGIGINAVQGAKVAGATRIVAIDPVEFKREKAMEFGATHTYESMEAAFGPLTEMTMGQMADKVIMAPGVVYGEMMNLGTKLAGKGSTIVVTGLAPMAQTEASVNLFELAMWNKEIKGTIFGSLNPRHDIPRLLSMYREGRIKLDELITRRYTLDQVNQGYQAMRDGENIRGVIVYD